jgi:hypothetical protein
MTEAEVTDFPDENQHKERDEGPDEANDQDHLAEVTVESPFPSLVTTRQNGTGLR